MLFYLASLKGLILEFSTGPYLCGHGPVHHPAAAIYGIDMIWRMNGEKVRNGWAGGFPGLAIELGRPQQSKAKQRRRRANLGRNCGTWMWTGHEWKGALCLEQGRTRKKERGLGLQLRSEIDSCLAPGGDKEEEHNNSPVVGAMAFGLPSSVLVACSWE